MRSDVRPWWAPHSLTTLDSRFSPPTHTRSPTQVSSSSPRSPLRLRPSNSTSTFRLKVPSWPFLSAVLCHTGTDRWPSELILLRDISRVCFAIGLEDLKVGFLSHFFHSLSTQGNVQDWLNSNSPQLWGPKIKPQICTFICLFVCFHPFIVIFYFWTGIWTIRLQYTF